MTHPTANDETLALAVWFLSLGVAELVVKPAWRRLYRRTDRATGDRLSDLK
jgi:hypothetical protein